VIENLQALDRSFFLFLNSFHSPVFNSFMVFLSGQLVWLPLIGFSIWHATKKHGKKFSLYFALFLFLALIASDVTSSYLIKNLATRLRPCREIDLKPLIYSFGQKCGGKFGFVSSHAANAAAVVFFTLCSLSIQKKAMYLLMLLPLLVGFSRIYLGVHYPGDILAGILVGTFWAYIFSKMFKAI
jgi:undecaprenyl-diphosphatase